MLLDQVPQKICSVRGVLAERGKFFKQAAFLLILSGFRNGRAVRGSFRRVALCHIGGAFNLARGRTTFKITRHVRLQVAALFRPLFRSVLVLR